MSPQLITAVQEAVARLETWKGRVITIEEAISRATVGGSWSYDRHFCTRSQFSMTIEFVGWLFSGNMIHVGGSENARPADYQLTVDRVEDVSLMEVTVVVFKEYFGKEAQRRSTFRLQVDATISGVDETTLLAESALAADWSRPEEDAAWQHLQLPQ